MSRRRLVALATAGLVAAACSIPAVASAKEGGGASGEALQPRVVATFPTGYEFNSFAESLAIDRGGNLFVSITIWKDAALNRAQLWKVTPDGSVTPVGPEIDAGILTGLVFDDAGNLYAGLMSWADDEGNVSLASGVLRYAPDGTMERVATLPTDFFGVIGMANGLAYRDGHVYVSDTSGSIWRFAPQAGTNQILGTPWIQDALLAPSTGWEGVNGIGFRGHDLMAVNADTGSVIQIPVQRDGAAGPASVVVTDPALVSADGMTIDADGGLWIVANHPRPEGESAPLGALLRVDRVGRVTALADDPGWLDYPSQAAFGTTPGAHRTLYIVNGSIDDGNGNLIAVDVGAHGQPLP